MFQEFEVPHDAIGFGFHEAVRGVRPHHMVIRGDKIADRHPHAVDEPIKIRVAMPSVMMVWRRRPG